ncbi:hypothetical protein A2841_01455 [Candidatus Kaiserbacteria bacterium RIFCSPHIGHO2_01_FULL_48_10]|uniref:Uncharacterized protein n=1 Tax=Candidatus Kaiserbacteria bacterium RIFCSPHIGHO2_01_FULL_48_10 TaxID=1798476 RepID=A0A1F6C1J0_9BACT|nr:MAG: hypothetical protein A2841_01455 [Candidatus Kaiserbacteria bacterium RIFCSPHIGHO2_01_FULL_48_10]
MSKGGVIVLLGFLSAFLPFTGFPATTKTLLALLCGALIMVFGFLARQERLWLLRTLSGEHKTDAYAENGASYAETTPSKI